MCRYNETLKFSYKASTLPHEPDLRGILGGTVRRRGMEFNLCPFVAFQSKEHGFILEAAQSS